MSKSIRFIHRQQHQTPGASESCKLKLVIMIDSTLEPNKRSLALVKTWPPVLKSRSQMASVAGTAATEAANGRSGWRTVAAELVSQKRSGSASWDRTGICLYVSIATSMLWLSLDECWELPTGGPSFTNASNALLTVLSVLYVPSLIYALNLCEWSNAMSPILASISMNTIKIWVALLLLLSFSDNIADKKLAALIHSLRLIVKSLACNERISKHWNHFSG